MYVASIIFKCDPCDVLWVVRNMVMRADEELALNTIVPNTICPQCHRQGCDCMVENVSFYDAGYLVKDNLLHWKDYTFRKVTDGEFGQ